VIIRVAQARRGHFHEDFSGLGIVDIELDAFKFVVRCTQDGRPGFHFDGLSDSPATVCAHLPLEWRRRLRQTRWRESNREFRYRIKGSRLPRRSNRLGVVVGQARSGTFHFVTDPTRTIPYRELMLLR
jgi:hypothetical protein